MRSDPEPLPKEYSIKEQMAYRLKTEEESNTLQASQANC